MKSAIKTLLLIAGVSVVGHTHAQDNKKSWIPTIGGTLRTKFEYQTDVKNSRFQVRDARIGASGWLTEFVDYKLQINLSDKGKIRTHDLFARLHFLDNQFQFTGGQFRVPISVDAARAPHTRWFANRSFVGKQIGNVFDIGAKATYAPKQVPLTAEFGVYNGRNSSASDDVWLHNNYLYVGHLKFKKSDFEANVSAMTTKPQDIRTNMYDACLSYKYQNFTVEAEYMYKYFCGSDAEPVHALNTMAMYALPVDNKYMQQVRFLGRFDMMTDDSSGHTDENGEIEITNAARKRATVGVTLGYYKKASAELRLNYEKYFYGDNVEIGVSDHDKFVAELMINF